MEQCTSCFKVNKDESLSIARVDAKRRAIEQDKSIAIVKDGEDFFFVDPFYAVQNNMLIIEVVSK